MFFQEQNERFQGAGANDGVRIQKQQVPNIGHFPNHGTNTYVVSVGEPAVVRSCDKFGPAFPIPLPNSSRQFHQ